MTDLLKRLAALKRAAAEICDVDKGLPPALRAGLFALRRKCRNLGIELTKPSQKDRMNIGKPRHDTGKAWLAGADSEKGIFRTAKNGKVYKLNTETGETSGLGPEIDGENEVGTLDKPAPIGKNLQITGFAKGNLDRHGEGGESDHSEDYSSFTKEQYAQRALELARSPVSEHVLGYMATNGDIVRYDESTNDWVKAARSGRIKTMFKPDKGTRYFERQMLKDGGVTYV